MGPTLCSFLSTAELLPPGFNFTSVCLFQILLLKGEEVQLLLAGWERSLPLEKEEVGGWRKVRREGITVLPRASTAPCQVAVVPGPSSCDVFLCPCFPLLDFFQLPLCRARSTICDRGHR